MNTCYICKSKFKPWGKHDCYCPKCLEIGLAEDEKILDNPFEDAVLNLQCAVLADGRQALYSAISQWHKAYTEQDKINAWAKVKYEMNWFRTKNFDIWGKGLDKKVLLKDLIRYAELPKITNWYKFRIL